MGKKMWKGSLMVIVVALFGILFAGKGMVAKAAQLPTPYTRVDMQTALEQKKLYTTGKNVSILDYAKGNGVMIKGKKEAVLAAQYMISDAYDFGSTSAKYLVVDGLCQKKKNISVEFILDGKTSIGKVKLARQKKSDSWKKSCNVCLDISAQNITGIHTLSYRIHTAEELEEVAVLMRFFFFTKSNLPSVVFQLDESQGTINEMNQDPQHETECYGKVTLNVPDGYVSEYAAGTYKTGTYELDYVRGRGNSTWSADKKPYKMKLSKKEDLLGMGKNKHWVLLANHYDITMLRNKFTYWLGAKMGMEYTPQCAFVDVIMNDCYLGSYYLCEQVRVGNSRVDIDDLEDTEETKYSANKNVISGGYLLSLYGEEDAYNTFMTENGMRVQTESPKFEDYTNDAQLNYIRDYFQKVEDAIYGENFKDENGHHYSEYMDINSAVDYYLVQELSMNGDAFISPSTYLYKKRNGKLFWGPLWDFDFVAWGATEYSFNNTDTFTCNNAVWFNQLIKDPVFAGKLIARWQEVRELLQQGTKKGGQIDVYSAQQYDSQKANYALWGVDSYFYEDGYTELCYDVEVERFKEWINSRIKWLDDNITKIQPNSYKVTFIVDGNETVISGIGKYVTIGEIMPDSPQKEGYVFDGWYRTKILEGKPYEIEVERNMFIEESFEVYAKWIDIRNVTKPEKLSFGVTDIYVLPYEKYDAITISVFPFDAYLGEITWTTDAYSIIDLMPDGSFWTYAEGIAKLTATASNGMSITINVHVLPLGHKVPLEKFSVTKKVTVKEGEYTQLVPVNEPAICITDYGFGVLDKNIAEIDANGFIYGKKAGKTIVCVYSSSSKEMQTCEIVVTAKDNSSEQKKEDVVKGFTVNGLTYKVLSDGKTVKCTGMENKNSTAVSIPATVTYDGKKYKVTVISTKAFKNSKKLKKVTIGKNVTQIGAEAFYGCKNLKTVDIKSANAVKVGKNAFKNLSSDAKVNYLKG